MSKDKDKTKVDHADFDDLLNDLKDLATIPNDINIEKDDRGSFGLSRKSAHTQPKHEQRQSKKISIDHVIGNNKPTPIHTEQSESNDHDIAAISNAPISTKSPSKSQQRQVSFAEFKASVVSSQKENVFNYNQTPSKSISTQQRNRSRSISLTRASKQEHKRKYPLTARSRKSRKERIARESSYTNSADIDIKKIPNTYVYNYRSPGAVFGFTPRSCNNKRKSDAPPVGLYQPKINGISRSKPVRGCIMSRSKRFKSISKDSATVGLYTPKWSYSHKPIAKGGTFGKSNRFNKYNPKKNRNYSANKPVTCNNEYIDYNQINKSLSHSKGGTIGRSRRFRQKKVIVPGPGTYKVPHTLNHSRLPYSIPTRQNK